MRAALALALLAAAPAAADPLPEVEAALDRAVADQRLLVTCHALEPQAHDLMTEQWAAAVAETVDALSAGGYDAEAVRAFEERAAPAALLPGPDATYAEVLDTCRAAAEQVQALRTRWSQTFRITPLPEALPPPFGRGD